MININICDDSEHDLATLKREIEKYEAKKGIRFNLTAYSNPEHLIYELEEKVPADIYILDVSMPEKNGFELADEIRNYTKTAVIIFLTSMETEAARGYKAKALRYLLKVNTERDLEEALDSAVEEISKGDGKTVTLHRYSDYWRIPYSDIVFVTRQSRQLVVTTYSQGELTDNRGITEFYKILDDRRFLFVDRGCFVNIDYICQLSGCELKMKDGKVLQISRRLLQKVKQILLEQWGFATKGDI